MNCRGTSPSPHALPERSGQCLLGVLAGRLERLAQLFRALPAPLGHLRPTPASPTGRLGGFLDPVAGLEALFDQVVADGRDEADLAVLGRAEHYGIAAGLLLQGIHGREELLAADAGDLTDYELARAERRRRLQQPAGLGGDVH